MAKSTRISDERARDVLQSQFAEGNTMTIDQCAALLGKHRNTIIRMAKKAIKHREDGISDPEDFPAMQTTPHSPYTIFFSDLKIWCNAKGMRI